MYVLLKVAQHAYKIQVLKRNNLQVVRLTARGLPNDQTSRVFSIHVSLSQVVLFISIHIFLSSWKSSQVVFFISIRCFFSLWKSSQPSILLCKSSFTLDTHPFFSFKYPNFKPELTLCLLKQSFLLWSFEKNAHLRNIIVKISSAFCFLLICNKK